MAIPSYSESQAVSLLNGQGITTAAQLRATKLPRESVQTPSLFHWPEIEMPGNGITIGNGAFIYWKNEIDRAVLHGLPA